MLKVVEFGPFDCRIDRGTVESLDELPECYSVVRVDREKVYVNPVKKKV